MYVLHQNLTHRPKSRVELHVHLDISIRPETIWELLKKKNLKLPGTGSLEELKESLHVKEPIDLNHFLNPYKIFLPAFVDDLEAIERIAYEFVQDQERQNVAYSEPRFSPQMFVSNKHGAITLEDALKACLKGFKKGEEQFDSKIGLILCCIRGKPEFSWDILKLCEQYKDKGVVGIDVCGGDSSQDESMNVNDIKVIDEAKARGIRITIHAGEDGGAQIVETALNVMHAERIGHGYRVLEDEAIYKKCLEKKVHFEMCPISSYMTGAIKKLQIPSKRHPILRLAEDNASFSINSDATTFSGTWLSDDYELLQKWGFTEAHFAKANFEAARRCFLPPKEKENLLKTLAKSYGFET